MSEKGNCSECHHSHGKLWLVLVGQMVFLAVQLAGAFFSSSQALLAQTLHSVTDSVVIIIACISEFLRQHLREKNQIRAEEIVSRITVVVMLGLVLLAGIEVGEHSWRVLSGAESEEVHQINTMAMMIVAVIGLVYSTFFAHRLHKGHSHQERILSWHLLIDAMGWLVTIISAVVLAITGNVEIDGWLGLLFLAVLVFHIGREIWSIVTHKKDKHTHL